VLALRPGLWSCGGEDSHLVHVVQVEFFVKDLWIGFVEGFSKEPKEPLRLEENLE
jgi:hypothetical protein